MEGKTNSVFTEIAINATPEQVWSVLTDWKRLHEWSSSFIGISVDEMTVGGLFMVYFKHPLTGGRVEFERVCTAYEEGYMFSWTGELIAGHTDNHIHRLETAADGTTVFKNEDGIHGKHGRFANLLSSKHMQSMYEKFNRQLKERVESMYKE